MKSWKCAQLSSLSAQNFSISGNSVTYCSVVEANSTRESIPSTGGASHSAIRLELDKGTIVRECVFSQKSINP